MQIMPLKRQLEFITSWQIMYESAMGDHLPNTQLLDLWSRFLTINELPPGNPDDQLRRLLGEQYGEVQIYMADRSNITMSEHSLKELGFVRDGDKLVHHGLRIGCLLYKADIEYKNKKLIADLIKDYNGGMIEYYQQHNYRMMYELWQKFIDNIQPII